MRSVRYNVAASLDGYIADSNGKYDWIPPEPAIDFSALFRDVDTVLMGRHSYELVLRDPAAATWPSGARVVVFSRTLRPADHPDVTVSADPPADVVAALRAAPTGGDIWLYGGAALFGTLLAARQVDRVEVTVIPILLGGGVPLLPAGHTRTPLALEHVERYPSGQVSLHYSVSGRAPRTSRRGS
jgi:dihydrofolate reductase